MNIIANIKHGALLGSTIVSISSLALLGGIVNAQSVANSSTSSGSANSTTQQQHLTNIINSGNQEITRRLTKLATLNSLVSSATKLSSSDKAYLQAEVNTEIDGLTSLKTKLDSETTVSAAITDAKSIYTDYRVFALIVPKVWLVKTADDQQVAETKLTSLAQKLQSRINSEKTAGKDVATLQNQLNDMTSQTNSARTISSSIESKVVSLQPSDYNSDHTILSGNSAQLKTAHSDNLAAYTDAKNIIAALKTL